MSAQLQLFDACESPEWVVRVSRRARRLSVRVYPGGRVEVVVPPGASPIAVQRFVGAHREWIDRRVQDLSALRLHADQRRPASVELPAIGRRIAVHYRATPASSRPALISDADSLIVSGAVEEQQLAGLLRQWLLRFAAPMLEQALQRTAAQSGLNYSRVQVRRQRTRWGSCSASGTISLNVCVLFLDPDVLRYLLIHELAHTRHMNHSSRFWALVASLEPDYRRLDRELTRGWRRVPAWVFG